MKKGPASTSRLDTSRLIPRRVASGPNCQNPLPASLQVMTCLLHLLRTRLILLSSMGLSRNLYGRLFSCPGNHTEPCTEEKEEWRKWEFKRKKLDNCIYVHSSNLNFRHVMLSSRHLSYMNNKIISPSIYLSDFAGKLLLPSIFNLDSANIAKLISTEGSSQSTKCSTAHIEKGRVIVAPGALIRNHNSHRTSRT